MKRFIVSICILALALEDVFATKPSDEFLAGDATPMDTDIKRSGMNEMNNFLSMGMMKTEMKACKDKISSKQCKKLKKKGKCKDKKTWKKCMYTCKKCPVQCDPATTCSSHGTCAKDGSCNCDVGFYGDSCDFPEICDDEPGLLRDGDKIHLLNQYFDQDDPKSYLDTCSEYKIKGCNGTYHVQTTRSPNRDFGSGTWEIRSVNGTGRPITYGDKIHLINQYGTKSYLDTCVDIETLEGCKGKYGLQTTLSPDRDSGSGTWEISSEKCIGGPVRNGDKILLINQYKKKSYLDTCSKYSLEGCNGTFNVQTSKIPNRGDGTSTWEIEIIFQGNEDFARFDKDADGLISLSEWIEKSAFAMNYTMISSMVGREMNKTTYNEIFNETDCDDDGNITPKELKMATEQLGYNCCGGICCPWCGTVIRTIVSALQAPLPSGSCSDWDLVKCTFELAGRIADCFFHFEHWDLVPACVSEGIGTASSCAPCVCDVVEGACELATSSSCQVCYTKKNCLRQNASSLINPTPKPGWVGGFEKSNPAFAYPNPDLSSLPMLDNMANIPKLKRQQKVVWPEFSWLTETGERCYQRFAPDISRLGYDDSGRVYSIICPQQGAISPTLGSFNVEVTVNGTRGWVNETTKEIAADMRVVGKIWFAPNENAIVKLIFEVFNAEGWKFPFNKDNAIVIETSIQGNPNQPIFPLTKGQTQEFKIPDFANWNKTGFAWSVAHLGVQIGKIQTNATEEEKVKDFNQLVLYVFNVATGNMLKEGNILTWNVWFTAPELVNQTEWQNHADCWRHSIDVDNTSPDGPGSIKRFYNGTSFNPLEELLKEEEKKVCAFLEKYFPDLPCDFK